MPNFNCNFFPSIKAMGEDTFLAEVAMTQDTQVARARAAWAAFPAHDAWDRPLAALARLRLPSPERFAHGAGVVGEEAESMTRRTSPWPAAPPSPCGR